MGWQKPLNICISIKISLKFVPINNIPDDGMGPTGQHAIIWTNDSKITDAYMCHSASMS